MPYDERAFRLPGRVDSYLATLNRVYERAGEMLLREIAVNGVVSIQEGWEYDNWNGGTYGHAITLTVPEDIFMRAMDAKRLAEGQYATFRVQQDQRFESDFEREVKRIEEKKRKEGGP